MDANYAETARYYQGNRLSATKQNGVVSSYSYDPHGSVVNYGNTAYQYDAFGNQLTDNNSTNPFRYCGEYFDEETGFIYLRNRYYDTTNGRFITEDPAKDGLNWYVYCANNPVMFVDPLGLAITVWDKENLSIEDLHQIKKNDQIWNSGSIEQKKLAQESSYNIRSRYLKDNQRLLDNGYVEEKISNEMVVTTSITGTVVNAKVDITRTYTEKYKYVSLEMVDVKVKTSSGFSVNSININSGQDGLRSTRNAEMVSFNKKNYTFKPNWGNVIDDGGAHTIIGTSIEVSVSRRNGKAYVSTIFNQLYNQEWIDENGKIRFGVDGFSVLQEALMRGERDE